MFDSNKGRLYSTLIIVVLVLALGTTIFFGERKQSKLKEENLNLSKEIAKPVIGGNISVDEDEEQSTPSPENISENNDDEEEENIVYSTENINVRSGPGTNYRILGSLVSNQRVTLIEKRSDGWSKILFNGREAYCNSSYLKEEGI